MSSAMKYAMTLGDLLSSLSISVDQTVRKTMVTDITIDSRLVKDGSLFCAYLGSQSDGRDYIEQSIDAGAVAVLCDSNDYKLPDNPGVPIILIDNLCARVGLLAHHFFGQPSTELQVFGVTGTNGKTTCCYLLVQAFTELGLKAAMIGTIGAGDLSNMTYSGLTTPSPIDVHRMLANWRDDGVTQVCMEVSSHALDQYRISGVQFYCTLFTNLSHDHLDYHGGMEEYATAKRRLFTDYKSDLSIINIDDELGANLIEFANSDFVVSYGKGGDVFVDEVTLSAVGMTLYIEANGVEFELETHLIGEINIPNILLVVSTLLSLSTTVGEIKLIVSKLVSAPGRMELFTDSSKNNAPSVVVDFAHTPDALEKALKSIRKHCQGELWCVFGCGGDRDKAKRSIMGAAANDIADHIIITNDNPRSESPSKIADDIRLGIKREVEVILDRALAIQTAIDSANELDWVLIAGRGHEHIQHVGEQQVPFSDRDYVTKLLGVAA